ncbi:MAG: ATP phosphoribosyltransferase regulatory subunit [Alphaproteobacteria bacterium]|nr:ATP phosphoribosyltransferase regulatory subunit [Alphaproteobacteria bacterium]
MSPDLEKALLPAGLEDELPPMAELEAAIIERLMADFRSHGYQRVKPPLIEFEESLLAGPGQALVEQTFRLMDPHSQRMMGIRPDMTLQVARIAASRLAGAPRPLRLSYAGQVLRIRGSQLRPERQFAQAGFELIGAPGVDADAEVLVLAAESLTTVGVSKLSADITLPTLVPTLCQEWRLDAEQALAARRALDRKDTGALAGLAAPVLKTLTGLLRAAGPADEAMAVLAELALAPAARPLLDELARLIARVRAALPGLAITVDPGEFRGLEYHTGLSFTLFAKGVRGEIGRGGRYRLGSGETATGFTVYLDSLKRAVAPPAPPPRLFVPFGTSVEEARRWRGEGWQTVAGLTRVADAGREAQRLGCSHIVEDGQATAL